MRTVLQTISWMALALCMAPAILYYARLMPLDRMKTVMLLATVVWFIATPLWMGREAAQKDEAAPGGP